MGAVVIILSMICLLLLPCLLYLGKDIKELYKKIAKLEEQQEDLIAMLTSENKKTVNTTQAELLKFNNKINKFESILSTFNNGFKPVESTFY